MGSLDVTLGRLIMGFLMKRPSETEPCMPCLSATAWLHRGPAEVRLLPAGTCQCNGRGYCRHTLGLGPKRTQRCTCWWPFRGKKCFDMPWEDWKMYAWLVVQVLINHTRRRCLAGRTSDDEPHSSPMLKS